MIRIDQIKLPVGADQQGIIAYLCNAFDITPNAITSLSILRRSIDARKKPDLYYVFSVEASFLKEREILQKASRKRSLAGNVHVSDRKPYVLPEIGTCPLAHPPVVVGAGPAGYFCALALAKKGFAPIVIERGAPVEERSADVEAFWETGVLKPDSNVSFGEGGAGTFSDGKLNTLVKDPDGRGRAVLETFVRCGAPEEILYDAKPHIGTDVLVRVVRKLREQIIALGGQVLFHSCMTDIRTSDGALRAVVLQDGREIETEALVLATGHSARDTMKMLYNRGLYMEQKPFAVGFRCEHPQEMINRSQYGATEVPGLGSAPYKLTAQTESGRGVFSFCMCPGGYVVAAATESEEAVVNGMSYSGRAGKNANSAIIISVHPEDFGSDHPLAGIAFQRDLEHRAYEIGKGAVPMQRYGLYRKCVEAGKTQEEILAEAGETLGEDGMPVKEGESAAGSDAAPGAFGAVSGAVPSVSGAVDGNDLITPQHKGPCNWGDLSGLLTSEMNKCFTEGMVQFGRKIKGFDREDVILSGVESRTSSPVRITRDDDMKANLAGIYPCGEGAGYAGGITSAAMDGLRVAESIISAFKPTV